MAQRKILDFWRGARQHPKWDIGTPPNPPPKRAPPRRLADPVVYLKLVFLTGVIGLLILPAIADALNGLSRRADPQAQGCKVVQVIDGDTVSLWCQGRGISRARLLGFDTPELYSPKCVTEYMRALGAKWQLRWLLWTAGDVKSVGNGTDRYGRALVTLFVDGVDVRRPMIGAGYARAYDGGVRRSWCMWGA